MEEFRSDYVGSLIHFTKEKKGQSSLDILCEILKSGKLKASDGFVKKNHKVVCFTETPLSSVKFFAGEDDDSNFRYRPYGIVISKQQGFDLGLRPVIYLPDNEGTWIPDEEKWRHVRFDSTVDYTFEREWRIKKDIKLSEVIGFYILHWNPGEVEILEESLHKAIKDKVRGYLSMEHLNQML